MTFHENLIHMILNSSEIKNIPLCYYLINWICLFDAFSVELSTCLAIKHVESMYSIWILYVPTYV